MAKSKVGSAGWRFTNSLFFVLSFVPILQWIPYFIMNGKLPKKKWLLMGFSNILILVMLLSGTIINGVIYDRNRVSYPQSPSLEDYMREDYLDYSYSVYEKFPELRKTIEKIKLYILAELNIEPSKEELLYLVIHINRFCTRAGL